MTRVLILSAPYGSGHDRVAAALAQAFAAEGAAVEVADHFVRFVSPVFARASRALFWAMLRYTPRLWGLAYDRSSRLPTQSLAMAGMNRLGATALARELAAGQHDLVVHVHPTPAGALSCLRGRGATRIRHAIVLTDFVAHAQWVYPHLDRYFVPDEGIREWLLALGPAAERVVVSGVPIDSAFALPADRVTLRRDMGLAADVPVVLVLGGMHARLPGIAEVCETLAGLALPFRAIAVCGVRAELARVLTTRYASDLRFRILGFVKEMHRVMGVADVVVTKAGGVTCAEALALERPLVLYRSVPGQERANEAYLERAGAGVRAPDRAALATRLSALLAEPSLRAAMAAAARRLRRPEAGRMVAKEMLGLATPAEPALADPRRLGQSRAWARMSPDDRPRRTQQWT